MNNDNDTINTKISFSDLKIGTTLTQNLKKLNITEPTLVQQKIIPLVEQRKNIMFQSETGTGKTFAYLLPLLQKIKNEENPKSSVKLMIAAPTYELASQIKVQLQSVSDIKAVLCIGGSPLARQIENLKEKPEVVIGGPSRLIELIHLKKLKADNIETLVLDEADRLLSPELRDETEKLLERLPLSVQLIGCSATVSEYTKKTLINARSLSSERIQKALGKKEIEKYSGEIELISLPPEDILRKKITHWAIFAEQRDKIDTLRSFIHAVEPKKLIVFTSRTDQIENITKKLLYRKINCASLSSKTDKKERKAAIDRFRSGKCPILITTDLASRGIDIAGISHVVQMDLPESTDFFIHRAGRTARAGQSGINCVIGDAREMQRYASLEKKLKLYVRPKILYEGKLLNPNDIEEKL